MPDDNCAIRSDLLKTIAKIFSQINKAKLIGVTESWKAATVGKRERITALRRDKSAKLFFKTDGEDRGIRTDVPPTSSRFSQTPRTGDETETFWHTYRFCPAGYIIDGMGR
jgi:hypothetical protein